MLKLVPMSGSDFTVYQSETLTDYVANLLKADGGSPDTAKYRSPRDSASKKIHQPKRDHVSGHAGASPNLTKTVINLDARGT